MPGSLDSVRGAAKLSRKFPPSNPRPSDRRRRDIERSCRRVAVPSDKPLRNPLFQSILPDSQGNQIVCPFVNVIRNRRECITSARQLREPFYREPKRSLSPIIKGGAMISSLPLKLIVV